MYVVIKFISLQKSFNSRTRDLGILLQIKVNSLRFLSRRVT